MRVTIMQLNLEKDTFFRRHTFPNKGALEFHIHAMGLRLPEREIFDRACSSGILFVWNDTLYHESPHDLRKEVKEYLESSAHGSKQT